MLYRSFSEVDLFELKGISQALLTRAKIPEIDLDTINCVFEGHSIFSIFQDEQDIYEQIQIQLESQEFLREKNSNGDELENSYLRRLHRTMSIPTSDWKNSKSEREKITSSASGRSCCKRINIWFKLKLGMGDGIKVEGGIGIKSIRKKSMHFKSSRFRESLMQISMLTEENSLIDFVQTLEDMKILFTSMSPTIVELFGNAFNTTRFTRVVRNLDWRQGASLEVFGAQGTAMTQDLAQDCISDSKSDGGEETGNIQNRQVDAKMLNLDWLHATYKGKEKVGFSELIAELAEAPDEALFATELVVTLVEHFWSYYKRKIYIWAFLPYLIYFITTLLYVVQYSVLGIYVDIFELTEEFFLRLLLIAMIFYFMVFEIVCIIRDGKYYFTDIYNLFDWGSFLLNFYVIYSTITNMDVDKDDFVKPDLLNQSRRFAASILILLVWVKFFYWMRLFTATSFYVRLISETLADIQYFLILFIFILMTFGTCMEVMNEGRPEGK